MYLQNIAVEARSQRINLISNVIKTRKIPDEGFDDSTIESFVRELSELDSNNFIRKSGVGEREARIACDLVRKRHYGLCHGIGRSGDIVESQPKAAGSSLLNQITNSLVLDFIQICGIKNAKKSILLPMATGMSLMLCLSALKNQRSKTKFVLWSRIDQKSCIKCITSANLIPIVIEPILQGDELNTNLTEFENQIEKLGAENIVCIMSTTSCFAPRGCDNIQELAKLAKKVNIPHIINNAYGLSTSFLTHQIETASRSGRIDLFVQSTDKNLLVPVGGAIISGFDVSIIESVSKTYVGRGSSSQTLDVFMTLLSLGRNGISKLLKDRKESFNYLMEKMKTLAENHDEKVLVTKRNPISIAMTLKNFNRSKVSEIGSMLFTRGVSGCRVITMQETKSFGDVEIKCWGSHRSETNEVPYLTAAASLGITSNEIDNFIIKLDKILHKMKIKS